MILIGIDFETTGLDETKDEIIEAAEIWWDTESNRMIRALSTIIHPYKAYQITQHIYGLTGIEKSLVELEGIPVKQYFSETRWTDADYVVAHNASFEKKFIRKYNMELASRLKWIDTRTDLPKHAYGQSASLNYLASDHKLLNPFPHQALSDVLIMMQILSLYDIEDVIERAESPSVWIEALVSFDEKDLAKERGFHWKPHPYKTWARQIKEVDLEEEEKDFVFRIKNHGEFAPWDQA